MILIVTGTLGTTTKGLVQGLEDLEIRGRAKIVQTTEFIWDQPEYWEESWILEETYFHSDSREEPSANADIKKSQKSTKTTLKRTDYSHQKRYWQEHQQNDNN